MKITQEVREYAAQQGVAAETVALAQGLREKAEEFRKARRRDLPRYHRRGAGRIASPLACRPSPSTVFCS
jgi:hypothetical protein